MITYTTEQLEEMISSEDMYIRREVAKQGYGLDRLINDKSYVVRAEVARQSYGLDILVNDIDEDVRFEVAMHGHGLDKLINDETRYVSDVANEIIKFNNHKVIVKNFGTYNGNLHLHYHNKNDYLIISGCYNSSNINNWKFKCEERLGSETAEKYTDLILKELSN